MDPKPDSKPQPVYSYLFAGAALLVFIETFALISPILLSFLLIVLISLAVNPVISRMRTLTTGGRKAVTGLMMTALIAVVALTGLAFFGPMKSSVAKLSDQLPLYWERIQKPLIKMEKQAVLSEEKLQAEVTSEIALDATMEGKPHVARVNAGSTPLKTTKEPVTIRSRLSQMLQVVIGSFTAVAVNAAQIMVVLVTVFFGVTFTLMNPRPIIGAMFSLVPEQHHEQALIIARRIENFVSCWAKATLMGMVSIAVLVFLLMWPVFGFVDALVLGLIAGVMEAIPFLGPILSAIPAILLAVGDGGMTPLWVLLAYIGVQTMENHLLIPLIMTRTTKLHPVAVIFSMLLCVAAFGVLGVIIAAPMSAIADILHDELYRKRFLPTVTDAGLDRLARMALYEKASTTKRPG